MTSVWVQLYYKGEETTNCDPVEIVPIPRNIGALKAAVLPELSPALLGEVRVYRYAPDTTPPFLQDKAIGPGDDVPPGITPKNRLIVVAPRPQQPPQPQQEDPLLKRTVLEYARTDVSCCHLSSEFLNKNNLNVYAVAAERCANDEEVKKVLAKLARKDSNSTGSTTSFSCIIAPSGTGKTQLAATAAASTSNQCKVSYFYTGDTNDEYLQEFYKPHTTLTKVIRDGLTCYLQEVKIPNVEDATALRISNCTQSSHFLGFLHKCLLGGDVHPITFNALHATLQKEKVLVFLDEIPPQADKPTDFQAIMVLRNLFRALGVCPILMSTHSGSINSVGRGSNSRGSDQNPAWCRIFVRLPNYVADEETFQENPWLAKTERPLVAAWMVAEKEKADASKIVAEIQNKLQNAKEGAWLGGPARQLCQLFRTKSGSDERSFKTSDTIAGNCKHLVVGTHFGHIFLDHNASDGKILQSQARRNWMATRRVGFVESESEPFLFLALTTWKIEHLKQGGMTLFPLVKEIEKLPTPISVREAFQESSNFFKKPFYTDNPASTKLDGDNLEVLALASITLASLQIVDTLFKEIHISQFLASVFLFMCPGTLDADELAGQAKSIKDLLSGTPFESITVPACPCTDSSFSSAWSKPPKGLHSGSVKRPADRERRDGSLDREGGNGKSRVVHIECRNLSHGLDTQTFEAVVQRFNCGYEVAVLFTSTLQNIVAAAEDSWFEFTRDKLAVMPEHEICFLLLEKDEKPKWLSLEKETVKMTPEGSVTKHLAVIIATGCVKA